MELNLQQLTEENENLTAENKLLQMQVDRLKGALRAIHGGLVNINKNARENILEPMRTLHNKEMSAAAREVILDVMPLLEKVFEPTEEASF